MIFVHVYCGKCFSLPCNEGYKRRQTPYGRSSKEQIGKVRLDGAWVPLDVAAASLGPAQGELPGVLAPLRVQGPGGKEGSSLPRGCVDGVASPVRADQETEACGDSSCLGDRNKRLEDTPEK